MIKQIKLLNFFSPWNQLNPTQRELVQKEILLDNIKSMNIIALIGSAVNILLLVLSLSNRPDGESALNPERITRVSWILSGFLYLLIVGFPRSSGDLGRRHYPAFLSAAVLSLLYASITTGLLSIRHGQLSVFIMMTFLSATFLYLSPVEFIFVLIPGFLSLLYLLIEQEPTAARFSQLVNVITTAAFSMAVSLTVFRSRFLHYLDHLIIENQNRELRRLSGLDGLTGIANRRQLGEMMDSDWPRTRDEHRQMSVIMIDVDLFKKYNDTLGHPAGDECLKRIANTITESLMRNQDYVGRYGGEEFLVVLPDTDSKGALSVAIRIAGAIEILELEHPASPFGQITVSQGIATTTVTGLSLPEELVSRADKALYEAKANGRNRIETDSRELS